MKPQIETFIQHWYSSTFIVKSVLILINKFKKIRKTVTKYNLTASITFMKID